MDLEDTAVVPCYISTCNGNRVPSKHLRSIGLRVMKLGLPTITSFCGWQQNVREKVYISVIL